ncbi:MAG: nucleotidyltransferase family protein [bacterium]|nr:nucleotidyltransferase family protein [bacterium]
MDNLSAQIIPILQRYGVQKAGLFGSFSRGQNTTTSDVDILIEPPQGMGLAFIDLKLELEKVLSRDVDLVSYNALHPKLKSSILASQKILL